jgi:hypothetical protein
MPFMNFSLPDSEHLAVLFAMGIIGLLAALSLLPAEVPAERSALTQKTAAADQVPLTVATSSAGSSTESIPEPSAPIAAEIVRTYPFKLATTTVFWVGEEASKENGFIHNRSSAWDTDWMEHFGGEDDPEDRCGYLPCDFKPKQNPFYVALPYQDLGRLGFHKWSARSIPWYREAINAGARSVVEGRWLEIHHGERICYAQWMDVGPYETDDFSYVFGNASRPLNAEGLGAGLDVSPAVRDCLDFQGAAFTAWRFVEESQVPNGPWRYSPAR